jgi:hypothetical protein
VRFDSDNRASQVLSGFLLLKGGLSGQPRVEDVPGLRGVTSFDNGSEAVAIGARGDVLFVIAYVGPDASPSSVDTFARDQYDLL